MSMYKIYNQYIIPNFISNKILPCYWNSYFMYCRIVLNHKRFGNNYQANN